MNIEVGQRWITRGGAVVKVTADRVDFAVIKEWRWSLSNGHIANVVGRVSYSGPHPSDLIELVDETSVDLPITDGAVRAVDSTMGKL